MFGGIAAAVSGNTPNDPQPSLRQRTMGDWYTYHRAEPEAPTESSKPMTTVEIGRRVRDLRQAAGLTMQDLAARLTDVHFTTVGKLETGKMKFTTEWIEALAGALSVPAASLMDGNLRGIAVTPTVGVQLNNLRVTLGVSFADVATRGGWRGPSSVQRYFEPHYDLPLRRDLAERLSEALGPKVFAIAELPLAALPAGDCSPELGSSHPTPNGEWRAAASNRLRSARIAALQASAAAAASTFGWEVGTYRHHENGTRNYGVEQAIQYGVAFNVSPDWLLLGEQASGAELEINGVPQPSRVIVNDIVYVRQIGP